MSFVRPEARAALWRWREVLVGAGMGALGLWWILGPGGLLGWIGAVLAVTGLALAVIGMQRNRFRTPGQGPGVVQVDEGRIAYFGPLEGGVVALSELDLLALDPTARPPCWLLQQPGSEQLRIPVNAEGADRLFDTFATLPGIRTSRLLAELESGGTIPVVIWQRDAARPRPPRLLH